MPNSMPDNDVVIRSTGRIPIIRASLVRLIWPLFSEVSQRDGEVVLHGVALRGFRSECQADLAHLHAH